MMSAELPSITEEPSSSNPNEVSNQLLKDIFLLFNINSDAFLIIQTQKPEVRNDKTFSRYRSLIVTECGLKITTTENYLKRLQNLRKELNYINETDWMYEPLDRKTSP